MRNALSSRTDLVASRKQIEVERHLHPLLPQPVDARRQRARQLRRDRVGRHAVRNSARAFHRGAGRDETGYFGALGDAFGSDFPTWSLQLQVNYPIGASNAEANLARARLQDTQAQKQLQSPELQVTTQIRDLARNVQTNGKRVEATRASRALAEKRLEAEEKKFQAGMTSSFLVIQAQRDLIQARNNELQAIIDYLKSVVDFETGQQAPLGRRRRRHAAQPAQQTGRPASGAPRRRARTGRRFAGEPPTQVGVTGFAQVTPLADCRRRALPLRGALGYRCPTLLRVQT